MSIARAPVERPLQRSELRRALGREVYILKRKWQWLRDRRDYVRPPSGEGSPKLAYSRIVHKSMILRPLKDVDMYLQHNKARNLELAIAHIDGVSLRPGEKFSLWKLVGRPTARKGYLEGLVLYNGTVSKGVGGGLCQLGNLLYWMVLHTDLEITERWRHSFDVFPDVNRTIPFACGATLAYNDIDLGFCNPTQDTYRIHLWIDRGYLRGEITCDAPPTHRFEVFETDHTMQQQHWGGYTRHNRIWKRRTRLSDGAEEVIPVSENHAIMMYNPLLEG